MAACSTTPSSSMARPWAIRTFTTTNVARSFLRVTAGGQLKGNRHVNAPDGTPMANVFLTLLHRLGVDDIASFGDSTGELAI